jgi:hypothetical protein
MANTGAEPCPKPDSFNLVHEWVSKKAWRDGSLRMNWGELLEVICRREALTCGEVSDGLRSLLDQGILKSTDEGFLVTEKFQKNYAIIGAADLSEGAYARSACASEQSTRGAKRPECFHPGDSPASDRSVFSEVTDQYEVTAQYLPEPRHPRSRRVVLCRETFPRMCRDAGIAVHPMQFSWSRLAAHIKKWEWDYEIDLDFVRQMMVVFVGLPELTHLTRSPDLLFISRREKLTNLVVRQHKNNTRAPGKNWGVPA